MPETTAPPPAKATGRRQKSWWIPWLFVGGFAIVLAVNGVMLTIALDSFTGIETEQAYKKGLAYNEQIDAAERQAELGWQVALAAEQSGPSEARIALEVADRTGRPLDGAEVVASLVRPTQAGHDRSAALTPSAPGRYGATVALPLQGLWDLSVEIRHPRGHYRVTDRLVLQ